MAIVVSKNESKIDCSLYVHSPIGRCGIGKIIRVKTPVKVVNRSYFADGDFRNYRDSRWGTDDGLASDAIETDVVLNNGADSTCDSWEEALPIFANGCHWADTTDEAYTSLVGVPNVSSKMPEELLVYATPTSVIIEAYKPFVITSLCR